MRMNNMPRFMKMKTDNRGRTIFYCDPIRVIMTCRNCQQDVDSFLLNYSIKDSNEKCKKLGCKKCGGEN